MFWKPNPPCFSKRPRARLLALNNPIACTLWTHAIGMSHLATYWHRLTLIKTNMGFFNTSCQYVLAPQLKLYCKLILIVQDLRHLVSMYIYLPQIRVALHNPVVTMKSLVCNYSLDFYCFWVKSLNKHKNRSFSWLNNYEKIA